MNALLKIITVAILLSAIQANAGETQQQGRYQIVINPAMRADTFLLDTHTGKIWEKVQMVDAQNEPRVWIYMDRIDSLKEQFEWQKKHPKSEEIEPGK